jgi:hypothetical protein
LRKVLFAFLLLSLPGSVAADASGAGFLLLDMDARTAAMGAASVASAGSLSGLRSNPAGLAGLKRPRAAFTHLSASGDWDHDWLAGAFSFGANTVGIELLSSRMQPFPYYDELGDEAGTLNAGSLQGALGLARSFPWGSLGATGRIFRGQLAEYSNWGYAGDLGAQWKPLRWARLGAALQHVGEQTAYYAVRDPLPTLWRLGAQVQEQPHQDLLLCLGLDMVQSLDPGRGVELRLGGEAVLSNRLALRVGGLRQDNLWSPSFGLGFKLGGLSLAYAFRPVESLGSDHMITLGLLDLSSPFSSESPAKK